MLDIKINAKKFERDMNNIVQYSFGFLDGVQQGRQKLMTNLGEALKQIIGEYIDSVARTNPQSLHHVYEWYQTGNRNARLFDIGYTITGTGLSMNGTLTQSSSVKSGSKKPFYNKAKIMEAGVAVTIRPTESTILTFDVDGKQVFTRKPVTVINPGGTQVADSFHREFKTFMQQYLSQTLLETSGLSQHLRNPIDFKKNINKGKNIGRAIGVATGMKWITKRGSL